ncbi:MAG: hypothetical protein NWF09_00805 [Candidatus Bathyarchaeota archaeon]|nr:hypothetical protein [Candidatus Bathyarchaeota archaeon]
MHLKLALKQLAISTLIVITLLAVILSSAAIATQDATTLKDRAVSLFTLFEKANVTVAKVFSQLEATDVEIPPACIEQQNQASLFADEAQNLLQAGNYSEAESKIIQALQKLKDALKAVYTNISEQPTETELALERTAQLKSSISRYYEQLQQLVNLTRFAASVGYNSTALETEIQTIKTLLNNASSNMAEGRLEIASANLADAKVLIEKLVDTLTRVAAELKVQRVEAYIAQTEVRLGEIKETARSLSNLASLAAVDDAEASLNNAKEYLEKQQIDETLSALASSRASEEEAVEYLKPTVSSANITSSSAPTAVQVP